MKSAFKIFFFLFLAILLLIGTLLITVSLSQNKIVDMALKELSEELKASIEVDEVSFTLFKKFPYSTFELSGIRLGNQKSYAGQVDSIQNILYIHHAFISVKTRPLFDYKFETVKVELEGANIVYHIDSLGASNVDFLLQSNTEATPDTSNSEIPFVELKELIFKEITIQYSNDCDFTRAKIYAPELFIKGQLNSKEHSLEANGNIEVSNCNIDSTNLYKMEKLSADFSIQYQDDTIHLDDLTIVSEGAHLNTSGKFVMKEELFTDVYLKSEGLDLVKLIKYVPQEILEENNILSVKGLLTFDGKIQGIINDSILPQLTFKYGFTNGEIVTQNYPAIEKLNFSGTYTNGKSQNNATTSVDIEALHLATKNSKVDARLSLKNLNKPRYVVSSNLNLSLAEFNSQIPDSIAREVSGKIKASFSTNGTIPDSMDDEFINYVLNHTTASFTLDKVHVKTDSLEMNGLSGKINYAPGKLLMTDLSISIPDQDLRLDNTSFDVTLTGLLTHTNQIGIQMHSFRIEAPQGKIWGSGSIQNLDYPTFQLKAHSLIHLSEMKPFLSDTLIKDISGNIGARIMTKGKIHPDSISSQLTPILLEKTRIGLAFDEVNVTLPDTLMQIKKISGKVNLLPDTVTISEMEGTALGIYFALDSTTIASYNTTILKNEPKTLKVSGNLTLGDLDSHMFDALLSQKTTDAKTNAKEIKDNSAMDSARYSVELKGKLAIKSLLYDAAFIDKLSSYLGLPDSTNALLKSYYKEPIQIKEISTKYKVTDSITIVDQFKLSAFGGNINSSIKWRQLPDGSQTINMRNVIDQMNIKQLLYDFNNFGQDDMITHENIRGLFSSDLYSRFVLDHDTIVSEDTRILGDLKLENGGVFNFEPAMEMSKFTGIKELDNIEFKTLESNIFMFKNKMYVPKTNIVSTSMDIAAFGMQSLEDDYEYHLKIHLSQILFSKSKKLMERQAKSGDHVSEDDVDKNAIKLIYAHVDGKNKKGFDNKASQKAMERKINTQFTILNLRFIPAMIKFDTGVK